MRLRKQEREMPAGRIRLGHGVLPAYFSQHAVELDERANVLGATQAATGLPRPQAQSLLGRFLFSGWEEHEKPVAALSGGERRRLGLALVVASGANFLVLDEPTNHLDLESREALEAALEAFPGTILLVSHDRALLDAVAERTLAIEGRELRSYEGGWADYVRARAERARPPEPPREPRKPREPTEPKRAPKPAASRRRPDPVSDVERRIEEQERVVAALEEELARDWADTEKVAAYRRARDNLDSLLSRWETLVDEVAPPA